MSKFEDGSYGCLEGIALIAKVLAGRCKMCYTRVAVGKGYIPEGMTPKTMRNPADYVMDAMISSITNPVDGECQISVQINSKYVETGFYATGLLLYAEDPDVGEVPYTYLVLENEPEWIRPASSIVGKLATFDIIAAVGDVDRVTASIDPNSIVTASVVKYLFEEHNSDISAHPDIRKDIQNNTNFIINTATEIAAQASSIITLDMDIPTVGWKASPIEPGEPTGLCADIPVEGVQEDLTPILIIRPACLETARACGFGTAVRSLDGILRVYANRVPAVPMEASLMLVRLSAYLSGGTITTDSAVREMLDEVFRGVPPGPAGPQTRIAGDSEVAQALDEAFGKEGAPHGLRSD